MLNPGRARCLLSLLFLSAIASYATAQTHAIAKLKISLANSNEPTNRARYAAELSRELFSHDVEAGLAYAQQSLSLATTEGDQSGIARALTSISTYYFYKGEMQLAQSFCWRAKAAVKGLADEEYPVITYLQLSTLHRVMAKFDSARYYNVKASQILEKRKHSVLHAMLWENEGLLMSCLARHDDAIVLLRRAGLTYETSGDSIRQAHVWRSMGNVFKDISVYDSSNYYLDRAERIVEVVNDPILSMLLHLSRGEIYFSIGKFDEAIISYSEALDVLEEHPFRFYHGISLLKIGEVYENEGAYQSAYELFYNAIKEFEEINASQQIQRTYTQIGWCYANQNNHQLALDNARISLNMARELRDSSGIGQNLNLVGFIHYRTKKFDEAIKFFEQAIAIQRKIKNWYGYSYSLYNLGLTYLELGQDSKATSFFLESINIDRQTGKKIGLLFTNNSLGFHYAKKRDYSQAAQYLSEANKLANEIPVPPQLLVNYKHYIDLHEAQKNHAKVIAYYKLYVALQDSLSNEANSSRVAKDDALFQLQKKANEIRLINKENKQQQKTIGIQEGEITFQRLVIILGSLGILILLVFGTVTFRLFRSIKRSKEKLAKQNVEILAQQEEIHAQSEDLKQSNARFVELNQELNEKNHEIHVQSEELRTALDALENVNSSLEKRVNDRTQELNQAYTELETFFYHTSHDFRRPLTSYLGLAELARATLKDKEALQLFDQVRQTTVGLDNMLIKLQSIGNVEYHNAVQAVDVAQAISDVLDKFHNEIVSNRISVRMKAVPHLINVNPFLFKVALENLIENSIRFRSDSDCRIEVEAGETANGFDLKVIDNGQGIDERWHTRIFEMYFRANETSKGNGLGLYIAKRAAEKMNGRITFTSTLDKGSCFVLHLPRT